VDVGDVIPEALVEASRTQHRLFAGLGVQQQIFYAALDQHLHSGPHVLKGDTKKILQSLQSKYWGIPYAEGTSWHARFGHLIGFV
jgi:intermediate peptidase